MSKIQEDRYYSLLELDNLNLVYGWNFQTIKKKAIETGELKAKIIGEGTGKRYYIKGSDIKKYLNN